MCSQYRDLYKEHPDMMFVFKCLDDYPAAARPQTGEQQDNAKFIRLFFMRKHFLFFHVSVLDIVCSFKYLD